MGSVKPKVYSYLFLSIICLLINISVFCTVLISDNVGANTNIINNKNFDDYDENITIYNPEDYPEVEVEGTNSTLSNFAIATGGSFVPFFSLLPLTDLSLPAEVSIFTTIIVGIIGAIQVFLLIIIVLNMAPKVLGSGFDV